MRATELIGCSVYDADGEQVGSVRDLLLQAGGRPIPDSGRPAYRLTALECGGIGMAHRLGYAGGQMAGPWPVSTLLRAIATGSVIVRWEDIARIDLPHIHLSRRRADLRPAREEDAP